MTVVLGSRAGRVRGAEITGGAESLPSAVSKALDARDFEGALPLLEKLVHAWRSEFAAGGGGEAGLELGRTLLTQGMVFDRLFRPEEAAEILGEAGEILLGVGASAQELGDLHDARGKALQHSFRHEEAEQAFEMAVRLREGGGSPAWADVSRDHLALLYLETRRYDEAAPLFHQTLSATPEDEPGLLAQRRAYLGRYYLIVRSFRAAETYLEDAFGAAVGAWGGDDLNTLAIGADLALARLQSGDRDGASEILGDLVGRVVASGADSRERAVLWNSLGEIALRSGAPAEAVTHFEKAVDLVHDALGEGHPSVAAWMNNFGCALMAVGRFDRAESVFSEAAERAVGTVGSRHVLTLQIIQNRALNALEGGEIERARSLSGEVSLLGKAVLRDLVSFGSERQRLNYRAGVDIHSLPCTLGGDASRIADLILATKGVVTDALIGLKRGADPMKRRLLDELTTKRLRLDRSQMVSGGGGGMSGRLADEVRQLEARLLQSFPPEEAPTWQQVQAGLPHGFVYVDYVQYSDVSMRPHAPTYGAVVIPWEGGPSWVKVGAGKDVGRWSRAFDTWLGGAVRRASGLDGGASPLVPLRTILQEMEATVWDPVEAVLPAGTEGVCICPDGGVHFVPFVALLDEEGTFFSSRYRHGLYVSRGADLTLGDEGRAGADGRWQIFAVEEFPGDEGGRDRRRERGDGGYVESLWETCRSLPDLPHAAGEAKMIQGVALAAGADPRLYLGDAAGETALRSITETPSVLHLITHGFFLGGEGEVDGDGTGLIDLDAEPLPFYRSGIVFSGLEAALEGSKEGAPQGMWEDAILFPPEAATLPLDGTWIVAVSSCQSGAGTPAAGEGVLGLRRALSLTGAQNVLLTHWPISEQRAPAFMESFYRRAVRSSDPAGALWGLQRDTLERLCPDPGERSALEEAVLHVAPYFLSQRGALSARALEQGRGRTTLSVWIPLAVALVAMAVALCWWRLRIQ